MPDEAPGNWNSIYIQGLPLLCVGNVQELALIQLIVNYYPDGVLLNS